jgi:hypothetical protein
VSTFSQLEQIPYMSKRFLLKRYLGLTEEEIQENEELWREERSDAESPGPTGEDLRSVGVTPAGLDADITTGEAFAAPEGGELGAAPGGVPGAQPGAQPGAAVAPAGTPPPA